MTAVHEEPSHSSVLPPGEVEEAPVAKAAVDVPPPYLPQSLTFKFGPEVQEEPFQLSAAFEVLGPGALPPKTIEAVDVPA